MQCLPSGRAKRSQYLSYSSFQASLGTSFPICHESHFVGLTFSRITSTSDSDMFNLFNESSRSIGTPLFHHGTLTTSTPLRSLKPSSSSFLVRKVICAAGIVLFILCTKA